MRFKVGDKIKLVRPFLRVNRSHLGTVGEVVQLRTYCARYSGKRPTHYVVKFDCYKRNHIFMESEIDESCDLINSK